MSIFYFKIADFYRSRAVKNARKYPYLLAENENKVKFKAGGKILKTGLTKKEKTTEIWFDEKEPIIYIKTHNTNLKNRLKKYAHRYSA